MPPFFGTRWFRWIALTAALFLYAAVHLHDPTLAPVSDDPAEIAYVTAMTDWTECLGVEYLGMFRPVKNLIFYAVIHGGFEHSAFKLTGLALLVPCFFATYLLLGRLLRSPSWAAVGAGLWLWHPANVVIFNWASAQNIAVFHLFSVLTLLAVDTAPQATDRARFGAWLAAVFGAAMVALFSYETAVALPLLGAALLGFRQGRAGWQRRHTIAIATLALAVGFFLIVRFGLLPRSYDTVAINPAIAPSPDWMLPVVSSVAYFEHLRLILWPWDGFRFLIPLNPAAMLAPAGLAWLAIVALLAAAWRWRKTAPLLGFALFWTAFALAPILNVIPLRSGPICDYYTSVAMVGVIAALLEAARRVWRASEAGRHPQLQRTALAVVGAVVGGLLLTETARREIAWRSERDLHETVVANSVACYRSYASLAGLEIVAGNHRRALTLIEQAVTAAPWRDDYYGMQLSLSLALGVPRDRLEPAIRAVLERFPDSTAVLTAAADFHAASPATFAEAEDYYRRSLAAAVSHVDHFAALANLGTYLAISGRTEEAIVVYEAYLKDAPESPMIVQNLARAREALRAGEAATVP